MKLFILISLFQLPLLHAFSIQNLDQKKGNQLVKDKLCDLHLSFGSYGSGTPREVEKKVFEFLKSEQAKFKTVSSWHWGMEGEYDLCLQLNEKTTSAALFESLKKIIPPYSKKGYTTLKDLKGQIHKTQWPKS